MDADTERRDIVERLLQPMASDPSEVQRERFLAAQEITRLRAQSSLRERDIDIVFDGPPGPEAGRFVEVEDGHGRSINVGEWMQRPDGLWALRLRAQPSSREVALEKALQRLIYAAQGGNALSDNGVLFRFLADRLQNVHGEPPGIDFILAARERASMLDSALPEARRAMGDPATAIERRGAVS